MHACIMRNLAIYRCRAHVKKEYVPQKIPFEGKSFPYIFNISTGCPWTKLYRKNFIKENNLQFMETHRSNDLYFVCISLAMAKRVTILEENWLIIENHQEACRLIMPTVRGTGMKH